MAGKTVKRSRVQAVKLRLQKVGKSKLVAEQPADTVATASTAVDQESDRPSRKQRTQML
jgi:hypothetical protein